MDFLRDLLVGRWIETTMDEDFSLVGQPKFGLKHDSPHELDGHQRAFEGRRIVPVAADGLPGSFLIGHKRVHLRFAQHLFDHSVSGK